MAKLRLLATYTAANGKAAKVYRNVEWDEYIVRWFNHAGVHMDASDHHTPDKQDALSTAQHSITQEDAESARD
jgi:hypothetical protein